MEAFCKNSQTERIQSLLHLLGRQFVETYLGSLALYNQVNPLDQMKVKNNNTGSCIFKKWFFVFREKDEKDSLNQRISLFQISFFCTQFFAF